MQITLNETELHEAVEQYIIGLGILAEGTSATVTLTGGGKGNNSAEYGATLEFTKSPRPVAVSETRAGEHKVAESVGTAAVKTETAKTLVAPAGEVDDGKPPFKVDEPESAGTSVDAGKSSPGTPGSSKEPDLTEGNPENAPFAATAAEGKQSKGISLFSRQQG